MNKLILLTITLIMNASGAFSQSNSHTGSNYGHTGNAIKQPYLLNSYVVSRTPHYEYENNGMMIEMPDGTMRNPRRVLAGTTVVTKYVWSDGRYDVRTTSE